MITIPGLNNIADLTFSQVKGRLLKGRIRFSLSEGVIALIPLRIIQHKLLEVCSFFPGKGQDLRCPLVGFLFVLIGKFYLFAGAILYIGSDQDMLHCNGSCLIIADFRVDVLNNVLVYLIGKRKFRIKPGDHFPVHLHHFPLRLIQGAVVSICRFLCERKLLLIQLYAVTLCQKVHGLDLCKLRQYRFLNVILQGYVPQVCLPDLASKGIFILILGIGQIDHDLREHTGHGFNPENLILLKPGIKDHLGICFFSSAAPKHGCKHAENKEKRCKSPFLHYASSLLKILLATLMPFAEACCRPLVTPAPSPMARSPFMLVSKSLFTMTLLE